MSKRKKIDAFFKKKDISNSEIRTPVAVETNVDTSMPDEHLSKCSRIQSKEINRDSGSHKQICEFPINKQDEIRRAYLKIVVRHDFDVKCFFCVNIFVYVYSELDSFCMFINV